MRWVKTIHQRSDNFDWGAGSWQLSMRSLGHVNPLSISQNCRTHCGTTSNFRNFRRELFCKTVRQRSSSVQPEIRWPKNHWLKIVARPQAFRNQGPQQAAGCRITGAPHGGNTASSSRHANGSDASRFPGPGLGRSLPPPKRNRMCRCSSKRREMQRPSCQANVGNKWSSFHLSSGFVVSRCPSQLRKRFPRCDHHGTSRRRRAMQMPWQPPGSNRGAAWLKRQDLTKKPDKNCLRACETIIATRSVRGIAQQPGQVKMSVNLSDFNSRHVQDTTSRLDANDQNNPSLNVERLMTWHSLSAPHSSDKIGTGAEVSTDQLK